MGIPVAGLILAAVFAAVVFFRKEIGETGTFLGTGFERLGRGVQAGVSALASPSIRPEFVPKLGLDISELKLPGSCGPNENGELKAPWVSCRPGGVSPNPFLCCYPRATPMNGEKGTNGMLWYGPGDKPVQEIRYDGRVNGNGKQFPSFNWDIENPPYIPGDTRLSGRLN